MRKIVEIEYVGIEDVQDILDNAYALMREGHYVIVDMSSLLDDVCVRVAIQIGGFDSERDKDYEFSFYMTDDKTDIDSMNECKHILNSLLESEG